MRKGTADALVALVLCVVVWQGAVTAQTLTCQYYLSCADYGDCPQDCDDYKDVVDTYPCCCNSPFNPSYLYCCDYTCREILCYLEVVPGIYVFCAYIYQHWMGQPMAYHECTASPPSYCKEPPQNEPQNGPQNGP